MKKMVFSKKVWNSISAKILLVFAVLLIPVYALLMISVRSTMNSLEKQAVNSAEAVLELSLNSLNAETERIDRMFYELQEKNRDYQKLCSWKGDNMDYISLYAVNTLLVSQSMVKQYTECVFVYVEKPDITLFVSNHYLAEKKNAFKDSILSQSLQNRNLRWSVILIGDKQHLFHTVGYYGVYAGASIGMNEYMEEVKVLSGFQNAIVSISQERVTESGKNRISVSRQIGKTGSYMHVSLDKREINQTIPVISKITYYIAIAFVLIFPLLLYAFWKMIVVPLQRIEKGIQKLGEGDQEYRIPEFKASDEFESVRESFNSMAGEIQTLKISSYEEKLEKEKMALQNLFLQIRPHFMLNSFNQIFSMAQLEDYDGIQKMSLYLSKFFRYLFRSNRIATIRSELDVVDNYLEMMNIRFLDCFEVEREIDETLLDYRIPPLLIHNFVENIFKYAVVEGSMITIRISLKKEGDQVVIGIEDDGPGMEPEILKKIEEMEPIDKADGTHIGIYNSAYRLRVLCGEQSRLKVKSVLTEGTSVKIMLPAEKKHDNQTGKEPR